MTSEIEDRIVQALRREAERVRVPSPPARSGSGEPGFEDHRSLRRRGVRVALAAVAATVTIAGTGVIVAGQLGDQRTTTPSGETSNGPTDSATTDRSLTDLPRGDAPTLPYIHDGTLTIGEEAYAMPGSELRLAATQRHAVVRDETTGTVWHYSESGSGQIGSNAVTNPVIDVSGSFAAWVERAAEGSRIVYQSIDPSSARLDEQALPDAAQCCDSATRVIGIDQRQRLFLNTAAGAWVWDTREGAEGEEPAPSDSDDYLWPVTGLESATPVSVTADELVVQHPDGSFGWGIVSQGTPEYEELSHADVDRLWITVRAIVAPNTGGGVTELESKYEVHTEEGDQVWGHLTLSGSQSDFDLGTPVEISNATDERSRNVLLDVTDHHGNRAWVRCDARSHQCERAADLEPGDTTPR